jgi:uncharacterized protein YyaL (SSP411 family)
LQQHAHNPVDWYPWGDEAFAKAAIEKKPIFLSIGYSACHWCHVMEREVFENDALAKILNDHFVAIKVDKEERPDIDAHFQTVHRTLTRKAGGWPTSIFLTHEKNPFYAATYIPPKRSNMMMGFDELATIIAQKYAQEPEILFNEAEAVGNALKQKSSVVQAARIDDSILKIAFNHAKELYDPVNGGFSQAPKFPPAATIGLLWDVYALERDETAREMAETTLKNMARGGMYDLVDGGFCRYSVDAEWRVPHFEKMTYDNALLIREFVRAFGMTGDLFYRRRAEETTAFMLERMSEAGLFYTASDADSEGEEGRYFVYGYEEAIREFEAAGLDAARIETVRRALDIGKIGNFEGKNILNLQEIERYAGFDAELAILKKLRAKRVYPFIDKKIITSQNAMMVSALFAMADMDANYLKTARRSLAAVLTACYSDGELVHSFLIGHAPKGGAFLEDYAYLAEALLSAYDVTAEAEWLALAQELANKALARFYRNGKWLFSDGEFVTDDDPADSSYPSATAVMAGVLVSLGYLADGKYLGFAFKTIEYASLTIARYPAFCATFVKAAMRYYGTHFLLKSDPKTLAAIRRADVAHPYVLKKIEGGGRIQVCSQSACHAECADIRALRAFDFTLGV